MCCPPPALQVLLSLPSFCGDLRSGRAVLEGAPGGSPLSSTGVYAALLECLVAKERWVLAGGEGSAIMHRGCMLGSAAGLPLPRHDGFAAAACTPTSMSALPQTPRAICIPCLVPSRSHMYITPAGLKRALDAHSAAFQGAFQQVPPVCCSQRCASWNWVSAAAASRRCK